MVCVYATPAEPHYFGPEITSMGASRKRALVMRVIVQRIQSEEFRALPRVYYRLSQHLLGLLAMLDNSISLTGVRPLRMP